MRERERVRGSERERETETDRKAHETKMIRIPRTTRLEDTIKRVQQLHRRVVSQNSSTRCPNPINLSPSASEIKKQAQQALHSTSVENYVHMPNTPYPYPLKLPKPPSRNSDQDCVAKWPPTAVPPSGLWGGGGGGRGVQGN